MFFLCQRNTVKVCVRRLYSYILTQMQLCSTLVQYIHFCLTFKKSNAYCVKKQLLFVGADVDVARFVFSEEKPKVNISTESSNVNFRTNKY